MKLFELFDKTDDLGHVVSLSEEFHAFKIIGGRKIRFTAGQVKKNQWEVEFAEESESKTTHSMTGKGHEFEVMSFVMSCFKRFIEKYAPQQILFSAKSDDESRVSLYRKMLKRFAKDYTIHESESGMDKDHKFKNFELNKKT